MSFRPVEQSVSESKVVCSCGTTLMAPHTCMETPWETNTHKCTYTQVIVTCLSYRNRTFIWLNWQPYRNILKLSSCYVGNPRSVCHSAACPDLPYHICGCSQLQKMVQCTLMQQESASSLQTPFLFRNTIVRLTLHFCPCET